MKRIPFLLCSSLGLLLFYLAPPGLAQSIKPGTEIRIHLIDRLNTGAAKDGQSFSAILAEPVNLMGRKVLARGTRINGEVTKVVTSGQLKRPASMTLTLTSIGKTPVQTNALQIDGKSYAIRNTALIGGGKGAAIDSAAGTGAEAGTAYATGKQEIVLPAETELTFVASDRTRTAVKTPEPAIERNIERVSESKPIKWNDDSREENDDAYDALIFSERDKWLISSYFKSNYGNLPPSMAKRGEGLPASLEKHLRRDETLSPALQERVESLPSELNHQLPMLPFGYSRGFISGRVLILADDGQIVDVMLIHH